MAAAPIQILRRCRKASRPARRTVGQAVSLVHRGSAAPEARPARKPARRPRDEGPAPAGLLLAASLSDSAAFLVASPSPGASARPGWRDGQRGGDGRADIAAGWSDQQRARPPRSPRRPLSEGCAFRSWETASRASQPLNPPATRLPQSTSRTTSHPPRASQLAASRPEWSTSGSAMKGGSVFGRPAVLARWLACLAVWLSGRLALSLLACRTTCQAALLPSCPSAHLPACLPPLSSGRLAYLACLVRGAPGPNGLCRDFPIRGGVVGEGTVSSLNFSLQNVKSRVSNSTSKYIELCAKPW